MWIISDKDLMPTRWHYHWWDTVELAPTSLVRLRDHACDAGIEIEDILGQLNFSRSTLDRWFRKWLGRSPNDEMTRVRLVFSS